MRLTTILMCFMCMLSALADSIPVNGGRLQLLDKEVSLGELKYGGKKSGVMRLTNSGTEPVVLISVFGDCNCTSIKYPRTPIEPGDTVDIKVTFDAAGRAHGPFRKVVRVRSSAVNTFDAFFVSGSVRPRSVRD